MLCRSDLEDDIGFYIKDRVPKATIKTVFDVGANVGWFTHEFGKSFRDAQFYLFEPSPPIFDGIDETLSRFPELNLKSRCNCFQLALGHKQDTGRITIQPDVTINRLITDESVPSHSIEITTGDIFCSDNSVGRIDYLKIDAEGYDMNVLIGFTKMLSAGAIDFVQVEAGMTHKNEEHIYFDVFKGFLSIFGFRLFRFINQASSGRLPTLSRADVVFIHESAASRYSD